MWGPELGVEIVSGMEWGGSWGLEWEQWMVVEWLVEESGHLMEVVKG